MTDSDASTQPDGEVAPSTPSQTPVATHSQATPDLESLRKEIVDLQGQVRALQSGKDKGTFKLEKKVADLEGVIAQYEELRGEGLSKARALRELKMDAFLQEQSQENAVPASSQPAQGSAPAEATRPEVGVVLQELGLDANDPQVIEAIRLPYGKREAQLTKIALLRNQAPNPATVQNTGGGAAVAAGDDLESVRNKLAQMRALPAYQQDRKEYDRLYQLERKLARSQ